MTPDELVAAAIAVADEGMARGELPIGAGVAAGWPAQPWFAPPRVTGGLRRAEAQEQFRRYCAVAPPSGFRTWAETLTAL